jgi:nucleoside diphosphate kinase
MRSFYGVDRLDNAYYISENFSEALVERDFLFTQTVTTAALQALESLNTKRVIKALTQATLQPTSALSSL